MTESDRKLAWTDRCPDCGGTLRAYEVGFCFVLECDDCGRRGAMTNPAAVFGEESLKTDYKPKQS